MKKENNINTHVKSMKDNCFHEHVIHPKVIYIHVDISLFNEMVMYYRAKSPIVDCVSDGHA